jgi:lysosomal acid phosphatase
MNTELVHNKTYAHRLPPTLIDQARGFANFHEDGVFSDKEIQGVGNSSSNSTLRLKVVTITHIFLPQSLVAQ